MADLAQFVDLPYQSPRLFYLLVNVIEILGIFWSVYGIFIVILERFWKHVSEFA